VEVRLRHVARAAAQQPRLTCTSAARGVRVMANSISAVPLQHGCKPCVQRTAASYHIWPAPVL